MKVGDIIHTEKEDLKITSVYNYTTVGGTKYVRLFISNGKGRISLINADDVEEVNGVLLWENPKYIVRDLGL